LNMPTLKVRVHFVLIVVVCRACGLENRYSVSGGYIYIYTLGAKGIYPRKILTFIYTVEPINLFVSCQGPILGSHVGVSQMRARSPRKTQAGPRPGCDPVPR